MFGCEPERGEKKRKELGIAESLESFFAQALDEMIETGMEYVEVRRLR